MRFEQGQSVVVTSESSSNTGMRGTIHQITESGKSAHVQLDGREGMALFRVTSLVAAFDVGDRVRYVCPKPTDAGLVFVPSPGDIGTIRRSDAVFKLARVVFGQDPGHNELLIEWRCLEHA